MFNAVSLAIDVANLQLNLANASEVALLQAAVTAALASLPTFAASVTSITLSSDSQSLVISGSVTAANRTLFAPGSITTAPNPITWTATTTVPPTTATHLQTLIQDTIIPLLVAGTPSAGAQMYSGQSPQFYVGQARFLADQLRAMSSANMPGLTAVFLKALVNMYAFAAVSNVRVTWVPDAVAASKLRRRSIATIPSALAVTFSYNASCLPTDLMCQLLTSNGPLGTSVLSALNTAFNSYLLVGSQCQIITGPSAGTYNTTCLNAIASPYCSTLFGQGMAQPDARTATAALLYNITYCGTQPLYLNGSCMDPTYTATALTLSSSVAAACDCGITTTTTTTTQPIISNAAASSSGGGGGIGIYAGAAGGGALLVILIVLVLWRRKRQSPVAKKVSISNFTSLRIIICMHSMYIYRLFSICSFINFTIHTCVHVVTLTLASLINIF